MRIKGSRRLLAGLFALGMTSLTQAATRTPEADGNWSAPATWGGTLPASTDEVVIPSTYTLTLDGVNVIIASLTVHGILQFSETASNVLRVLGGDVVIEPGGRLFMGTETTSIVGPNSAQLWLASTLTDGEYGLIVKDGGVFHAFGDGSSVLIRSSSTVEGESAYVRVLTHSATSFTAELAEFAYLGADQPGRFGITFDGLMTSGDISSSTIRNGFAGVAIASGARVSVHSSQIYGHSGAGVYLMSASSCSITGNTIYGNLVGLGVGEGGTGNLVIGNRIHSNTATAVELKGPQSSLFADNVVYGNNEGIWLEGATGVEWVRGRLGISPVGVQTPNGGIGEIGVDSGFASRMTLRATEVNASRNVVDPTGLQLPNSWIMGYELSGGAEFGSGKVTVWGDRLLVNETLSLDYAYELYGATVTTPIVLRGQSISALAINALNAANLSASERIVVEYDDVDLKWYIKGDTSGTLCETGPTGGVVSCPGGSPKFDLTLSASGAQDADRAEFYVRAKSAASPLQKKLWFGPSGSAFGGKSKLTINSGSALQLAGDPGAPTLIERMGFQGATSYSLLTMGSGGFSAILSSFTNADDNGLQFTGNASVSLSTCSFDWAGIGAPSSSAYITLNGLTQDATFYGLSFGDSRMNTELYNIRVQGADTGLRWALAGFSGPRSGSAYEWDPNSRIRWIGESGLPPGAPSWNAIHFTSMTVVWGQVGTDSGYLLELSTASNFTGVLFSSMTPQGNATMLTVTGLSTGIVYFGRVGSLWGGTTVYAAVTPPSQTTLSYAGVASNLNAGQASIQPATLPESAEVQATTVTFVVPSGGWSAGAKLKVQLPFGWYTWLQTYDSMMTGYVSAASIPGGANLQVQVSTHAPMQNMPPYVEVTLQTGTLSAGNTIQVRIDRIWTNCPPPNQTSVIWSVFGRPGPSAPEIPASSQPIQTFASGNASRLSFYPQGSFLAVRNTISAPIVLRAESECGNPVPLASPMTVTLSGLLSDWISADGTAQFSTMSILSPTTTTLNLTPSVSSATVYYRTSSSGYKAIRAEYLDPRWGTPTTTSRSIEVRDQGVTISGVGIDNGAGGTAQTTYTLSPDYDGQNDFAFIRFALSDSNVNWRVLISSDGFNTLVYERYDFGDPLGRVSWDGRICQGGFCGGMAPIAPNGTYQVKIEVPGLATDTSLAIVISAASINGRVTLGGTGVPGAWVNANPTSGTGGSGTNTDGNGYFTINGLKTGQTYNLNTNFYDSGSQAQLYSWLNNITAPASNANIVFSQPARIRVAVSVSQPAQSTIFGSVQAERSDHQRHYSGTLRIQMSSTTSDNGDTFNPSSWTVLNVEPGTYQLRVEIPGYSANDQTVTVAAGQTMTLPVINLVSKATIFGKIEFSSPTINGTWINVDGQKSTMQWPSVWGGFWLDVGESSGIYRLFNVDPGTWTIRVRAPGFAPVAVSTVVGSSNIGNENNGGLDFSSAQFTSGGRITGTITINGDTTRFGPSVNLWLNAYSELLGSGEFAQVSLSTHPTTTSAAYQIAGLANGVYRVFPPWLEGFELSPPGPRSVTVTGGVGTLNLVLQENSGQINGTITLPGASSDYDQVILRLNGPSMSTMTVAGGSSYSIPRLGSGYYSLSAYYATTGAQVRQSVAVVNGQTSTAPLDLSAPTYSAAGSVSLESPFTVRNSSGGLTTISTLVEMLAASTTQQITIGTATVIVPTARVEAFPKSFDSFGDSNRDGFMNEFNEGGLRYAAIGADGSFVLPRLRPGVWELAVYPFLTAGTEPNFAAARQTIRITTASVSGLSFACSSGYSLTGTIQLPPGVSDNRNFSARIVTPRGEYVQSTSIQIGSYASEETSASFEFKGLPTGKYALVVTDPGTWDPIFQKQVRKYVAKPLAFEIAGANLSGMSLTMSRAGRMIGKISVQTKNPDGTPSSTLITANNKSQLPENFQIWAEAVPWVEGGWMQADRDSGGMGMGSLRLDGDNQFQIDGLVPGTYDVRFRQDSWGMQTQSQATFDLAPLTKSQIRMTEGQIVDLGTVELKQGLSLKGTVHDTDGNPLPNIQVRARRAAMSTDGDEEPSTYTDALGQFLLKGLDATAKAYHVTAAPRPWLTENRPPAGYGAVTKRAVDVTQTPLPELDFELTAANASLSGAVLTADGGALGFPENDDKLQGYPVAAIYMSRQGSGGSGDNPLGDITEATRLDGTFSIANLVPGTYNITIMSRGYKPNKQTLKIVAGANTLPTVTLAKGGSVTATLRKPDGSAVNTDEVEFAVAATSDLGTILFGQIENDETTRNITQIAFSGFETGKTYSLLLFDPNENIMTPPEGRSLVFSTDTEEKTLTLTYQPSAPNAFAQVRRVGTDAQIDFYLSRPLRNTTEDDDAATSLISIVSGGGTITEASISDDRRQFSATYSPASGEETATLRLSAYTADVNAQTGAEFQLVKSVVLRFGQRSTAEKNISPVLGGEITLATVDSDPSGVDLPANALRETDGSADVDASYEISFTATDDASQVAGSPRLGAQGITRMMARGASAYVPEVYEAMRAARAAASVNPLSSFYSVLLPAGVSHTLNQSATLTLQYSNGADPDQINIYFFDGTKYLIENRNRLVDTVNRTISVSVSHFSTFVILEESASVVTVDGDASTETSMEAFNFPNPFDLNHKPALALNRGGSTSSMDTDGTIIRYTIPASKTGAVSLQIYDLTGNKVRDIDLGSPARDTYHYVAWDGKNDSGNKVASGVYLGVLKAGDAKKVWKMAVIK